DLRARSSSSSTPGSSRSRSRRAADRALLLDDLAGRREDVPEAAAVVDALTGRLSRLLVRDVRVERPPVVRDDTTAGDLVRPEQRLLRGAARRRLLPGLDLQ